VSQLDETTNTVAVLSTCFKSHAWLLYLSQAQSHLAYTNTRQADMVCVLQFVVKRISDVDCCFSINVVCVLALIKMQYLFSAKCC